MSGATILLILVPVGIVVYQTLKKIAIGGPREERPRELERENVQRRTNELRLAQIEQMRLRQAEQRRLREAQEVKQQRLRETQEAEEAEKALAAERLAKSIIDRRQDIIETFLRLAERKVSTLDDYGDESWDNLNKEITRCIQKLAKSEDALLTDDHCGRQGFRLLSSPWREWALDTYLYKCLYQDLERQFREFHARQSLTDRPEEELNRMTGVEFENHVSHLLKAAGCNRVSATRATGDQGADIIACYGSKTIIIQAKRSSSPVGNKAVQEVVAALPYYAGTEAWVVTNSRFTRAAEELAARNLIRLIDGPSLRNIKSILEAPPLQGQPGLF